MQIYSVNPLNTNGYDVLTNYWEQFSLQELFGPSACDDAYYNCLNTAKNDYKKLTELVMVIGEKMWQWYDNKSDKNHIEKFEYYEKLYNKAYDYAEENLNEEELKYFHKYADQKCSFYRRNKAMKYELTDETMEFNIANGKSRLLVSEM